MHRSARRSCTVCAPQASGPWQPRDARRYILCHDEQSKGKIAAPEDRLVRSMPHYGGVLVIMALQLRWRYGYSGVVGDAVVSPRKCLEWRRGQHTELVRWSGPKVPSPVARTDTDTCRVTRTGVGHSVAVAHARRAPLVRGSFRWSGSCGKEQSLTSAPRAFFPELFGGSHRSSVHHAPHPSDMATSD